MLVDELEFFTMMSPTKLFVLCDSQTTKIRKIDAFGGTELCTVRALTRGVSLSFLNVKSVEFSSI